MNVVCIRHTDLPGTTSLFGDLVYRYDRVEQFYAYAPRLDEAKRAAAAIEYPAERRAALVEALAKQNSGAGPKTEEHLDLLADNETVVVATGQQTGLLGGPIFSLYKALTAAKYAAELRRRGTPAVAVFWLATEDHDLDEVDHAWVFDASLHSRRISSEIDSVPGRAVGGAILASDPAAPLADLFVGLPYADEACERLSRAYRAGESLGTAFRDLIRDLTRSYGLITLDPMDPAIRRLAAPLLAQVAQSGPDLIEALLDRGAQVDAAGYHQQVKVDRETSLLFRFKQQRRIALKRQGEHLSGGGDTWQQDALAARILENPDEFSPNALLRPVTQDYLMPTAVFIGGPAELAYLAQSGALYDRLLGRRPVMMPRAAFTLLDRRAMKLLERYRLNVQDCLTPFADFKQRLADSLTPPELQTRIDAEKKVVDHAMGRLSGALASFDPTLGEAFERSRRKITYQLEKMEGKAARESLRRSERGERDALELAELIFPHRSLQERLYSVAPFLARYGDNLVPAIYDAVNPDCPDHQVLAL